MNRISFGKIAALALAALAALGAGAEEPAEQAAEAPPEPAVQEERPVDAGGPVQDGMLGDGWKAVREGDYLGALRLFQKVHDEPTDEEIKAEALYGLGLTWQIRDVKADAAKAAELYERVFTEFGATRAAPWAMLSRARLFDAPEYEDDRDVPAARKLYERVLETWPDHYVADEAAVRLARTFLDEVTNPEAQDRGAAILTQRLAKRPKNVLAALMHNSLGGLAAERGEYRKAIEHWIATDEAGITSLEGRAATYFKIAQIAEHRLKDYALAARWYERIVKDIRINQRYFIAEMGAERCRRLAGRGDAAPEEETPAGARGGQP